MMKRMVFSCLTGKVGNKKVEFEDEIDLDLDES
jgi:hypothetical protein